MTTPQLHYTVRCYNDDGLYGHYTEAGYFDKLCTAFQKLIEVKIIYLFIFFFWNVFHR
jgi:phosphoacetylglucosamine mutase